MGLFAHAQHRRSPAWRPRPTSSARSATTSRIRARPGTSALGTEFETLLGNEATATTQSGGVQTGVRYGVTDQGTIASTIVGRPTLRSPATASSSSRTAPAPRRLTRAGSFVPDASGNLINTAGYKLMGYSLDGGDQFRHAVGRQREQPGARGQRLDDRHAVGQPALDSHGGGGGLAAVDQHERRDLHRKDVADRLRQSRHAR